MNQIVEVELRGLGKVSLVVDANLLTMDTADRQFVFGLVDAFRDYGSDSAAQGISQPEAQTQQEVEQLANAPAGAPSVDPPFVVLDEADAPPPATETYPYTCDRCRYEAAGPKSLEVHERTCRVPFESFTCPVCGLTNFSTPQALGAHKRYKHGAAVAG